MNNKKLDYDGREEVTGLAKSVIEFILLIIIFLFSTMCFILKPRRRINKLFIFGIFGFALILLSFFVSAALTDNNDAYWKFDSDTDDAIGARDATNFGATYTASGKINGAYLFDASNDYMTHTAYSLSGAFTMSFWLNLSVFTSTYAMCISNTAVANVYFGVRDNAGTELMLATLAGTERYFDIPSNIAGDDAFHMITFTRDESDNLRAYLDGTESTTGSISDSATPDINEFGRFSTNDAFVLDGVLDEISYWSRQLSDAEVSELYNSGSGFQYPYTPGTVSFELSANNLFNTTSISYFSADITNSSTTQTTVTTNGSIFYPYAEDTVNITIYNITGAEGVYFNRTYSDYNVTTDLDAPLWQAKLIIDAYDALNFTDIPVFNFTIYDDITLQFNVSNATNLTTFLANADTYTYSGKADNFSTNQSGSVTLSTFETKTITVNFTLTGIHIYGPFNSSTGFNIVTFNSDCSDPLNINVSRSAGSFQTINSTYGYEFPTVDNGFYAQIDSDECSWIIITTTDYSPPVITIINPIVDGVYNSSSVDLNWTIDDTSPDWCAYSLDGAANDTSICPGYNQIWNLNYYIYDLINISTLDSASTGIFFKPDGTKLYEIGSDGDKFYQYSCSSAWDLSSCTDDIVNISTQDIVPKGIFFKPDGTKLYEIGSDGDKFYQYSCSSAWDLSSCTYDIVNISTQDPLPTGMFFRSDGTSLYEIGNLNDLIYQYSCSEAWNLTTCAYGTTNINSQDGSPTGIFFKPDGLKLYEIGRSDDLIYQYSCSEAWNLTTCAYTTINILVQDSDPQGIFFKPDGLKLYYPGDGNSKFYQHSYSISITNITLNGLSTGDHTVIIYANDTVGSIGNSTLTNFTIQLDDTCSCPAIDTDWEINMGDFCNITSNCDIGTGVLNFTGVGITTCNAILNQETFEVPSNSSQYFKLNSSCHVNITT